MPRKKTAPSPDTELVANFGRPPNTASLSESRVYRLENGTPVSLKAEVSGPMLDQPRIIEGLEQIHEDFRVRLMENNPSVSEVGILRKRESRYHFTAAFAESGTEGKKGGT